MKTKKQPKSDIETLTDKWRKAGMKVERNRVVRIKPFLAGRMRLGNAGLRCQLVGTLPSGHKTVLHDGKVFQLLPKELA